MTQSTFLDQDGDVVTNERATPVRDDHKEATHKQCTVQLPNHLIPKIDKFKNMGITKSRTETLSILIASGLESFTDEKMLELQKAAETLRGLKEISDI